MSVAFTRIFSSSPLLAACCFSRRSLSWEQIWKKQLTGQTTAPLVAGGSSDGRSALLLPRVNQAELFQLCGSEHNAGYLRAFQDLSIPRLPNISVLGERSSRFLCSATPRRRLSSAVDSRHVFLDWVKFRSVAKYVVFLIPSVLSSESQIVA